MFMKSLSFLFSAIAVMLILLTVGILDKAFAQSVDYFDAYAANPALRVVLPSEHYAEDRELIIQLPQSYFQQENKRYPVIYLLDGERNAESLIFISEQLAARHKMPEVIIVAIPAGKTRQLDYTPNNLQQYSSAELGNADRFTEFLRDELLPHIDSKYRTQPYRVLSGHSRSGLFAFNDLLNQTGLFQAYLAFSPALWVSDSALVQEAASLLQTTNIGETFFYMNAGGDEGANILAAYSKMEQLVEGSNTTELNWHMAHHPDDSHGTTPIPGHYLGLRRLFANWDKPWETDPSEGLAAVAKQFDLLSDEFGYRVVPDVGELNTLGAFLIQNGRLREAIEVFELNAQYHPYSADALDGLAIALEAQGELLLAAEAAKKATTLIGANQDAAAVAIRERYAALVAKIENKGKGLETP